MTDNLIIHHSPCLDGFTAAWIAARHFELTVGSDSYELFPTNYGQPSPTDEQIKGRNIYILDFSYPRETILHMWEICNEIVVLDHHRTSAAYLSKLSFCTFNMHKSGARLAAEHFGIDMEQGKIFIGLGGMELVDFVEDYDLWKFELPETMYVHQYLNTLEQNLWNWDQAAGRIGSDLGGVVSIGKGIDNYVTRLVEEITGSAKPGKLPKQPGLSAQAAISVACPKSLVSLVAHKLLDIHKDQKMAVCYYLLSDGTIEFGLRSRSGKECDVSKVAEAYGGGGHATAAGFRVSNETG